MTDRPILFSAPMVRALLAGTKTQTRRALNLPGAESVIEFVLVATRADDGRPVFEMKDGRGKHVYIPKRSGGLTPQFSPKYAIGDHLWVREAWRAEVDCDPISPRDLMAGTPIAFEASPCVEHMMMGRYRPGMFMPRWASRLTLPVTEVRVQRLQDISETDAIAEGIVCENMIIGAHCAGGHHSEITADRYWNGTEPEDFEGHESAVDAYAALWDHINGAGAWDANPWVVAVSFNVNRSNIDQEKSNG
jgi:hypothetical protein